MKNQNRRKKQRLGKRMKAALEYLGEAYTTRIIDGENCIYRNLGNGYDIEISGIARPRRDYKRPAGVCNFVCVWDTSSGMHSVEYVWYPQSLLELKRILNALVNKYGTARRSA